MIAPIIFLLFFPASLLILGQAIAENELSHQLLAFVLLLFSLEQARMAVVDLESVAEAKKQVQDSHLDKFSKVVISTIIIELLGFYISSFGLGVGMIIVLLSQIGFNLFAGIKIELSTKSIIQKTTISERFPELIADVLALILVGLWLLKIAPLAIATSLAAIAIAYGCVKYLFSSQQGKNRVSLPKG